MAQPAHVALPAHLSAPIKTARADVLPPVCRRCNNTRRVQEIAVKGLTVATTGRTVRCPDC